MTDATADKAGPGPANYFLPSTIGHNNHDISKSRSPSFSIGVRLPGLFCEQNIQSPSPGPKYQVEYLTKYGKANVASGRANLKRNRPRSCNSGISRNGSLERNKVAQSNSLQKNSSLEAQPTMRNYNTCEKRESIKVGDSKVMNLNNELRAFCKEFGDKNVLPKSRIGSARRNSHMSPMYRTDIKHARY